MIANKLYGLAYACPKNCRQKDCPLIDLDHLSFKEKVEWINKCSDVDIKAILIHHSKCTKQCNKLVRKGQGEGIKH